MQFSPWPPMKSHRQYKKGAVTLLLTLRVTLTSLSSMDTTLTGVAMRYDIEPESFRPER